MSRPGTVRTSGLTLMAMRVCPTSGCGTLVESGYCTPCGRQRDADRGRRQDRGYDAQHDRIRAAYQRRMDAGETFTCWRCAAKGKPHPVDPTNWDLGHDDTDRTRYRGPECPPGNRATASRRPT